MSKRTPGNWIVKWSNSTICEIKSEENLSKPIAELDAYYNGRICMSHQELESNAILIADAPFMFHKLSMIYAMYQKGIKPSVGMIKEIESLIQKHS